jgi:hypothetical protein
MRAVTPIFIAIALRQCHCRNGKIGKPHAAQGAINISSQQGRQFHRSPFAEHTIQEVGPSKRSTRCLPDLARRRLRAETSGCLRPAPTLY